MAIRITFDSKTIVLEIAERALEPAYRQKSNRNMSGSGKAETINLHGYQEHGFESYFSEAIYEDLIAWWSWARQGALWSFAFDSDSMGNTTLSSGALAGQKVIPLANTTPYARNDVCYIQSQDDDRYEIVEIATTGTGEEYIIDFDGTFLVDENGDYIVSGETMDEVTVTENLKFSYESGDIFRHWDYWPEVFSLDAAFAPPKHGNYYKHLFRFGVVN